MTAFERLGHRARLALVATICQAAPLVALAADSLLVIQKGRQFDRAEVTIDAGSTIAFENRDPFLHQLYVASQTFSFDSNEQSPNTTIDLRFPVKGDFRVMCGIHPKMALSVHVR